jgi:transposase-like protein
MAAPRKYGDELRERATRMALEARQDPATRAGAIKRVADQLGMHPETLELGAAGRERRRCPTGHQDRRRRAGGPARAGGP